MISYTLWQIWRIPKCCSYSPDMDQNGLISREDLYEVMDMITDTQLSDEQKAKIVDEVRK